tara:strand:+ start:48 stop:824 length:777 start_codon:yes stop_codon:yes gene_type:complete
MGKYSLSPEIKPIINKMGNVAFTAGDLLFDWISFEIPNGVTKITGITAKVAGAVSVPQDIDFNLIFAKSINGVAPLILGLSNGEDGAAGSAAHALLQRSRPNIIASYSFDGSDCTNGIGLGSYSIYGGSSVAGLDAKYPVMLYNDDASDPATEGYQTIYVAGFAVTSIDFGTNILIAGEHAADDLTIVVDGTPGADGVFCVGDIITAFHDDGSAEKAIGTVTALSDNLITVDAAPVIIPDNHEVCNLSPITFRMGLEY